MLWRIVGIGVFSLLGLGAQDPEWHHLLRDPHNHFEDIRRAFERRHGMRPQDASYQEEEDFVHFGRWENFWETRLMPDGSFPTGEILWQELQRKIAQQRTRKDSRKGNTTHSTANFTLVGPTTLPTNGGAGRINCMTFHPTNTNTVFVGSPSGGMWKSTNGGTTWTSNTDSLATLGVSAIAIDPTNPSIIYLGTGDRDARDTYSVGILKSTDGGTTWNVTGLNWTTPQNRVVCDILIVPSNTSTLIAATSIGIWRSTDGGQSWSQRTSSYTMELRMHPTITNIIFASTYNQSGGAAILRSTDGGVNWATVWSNTAVNRIALAVSPTAPRRVYALCSSASGSGFYGLYLSLDTGSTWSQQSSSPNILGSNTSGTSSGGQGWFDLCLVVHPTDSTMLFAGGINIWRSTNSGQGWSIVSYWQEGTSIPYVHADQHAMLFKPNTTELWVGNDGGVFRTTNLGSSWADLSSGLAILQVYRLSIQRGSSSPAILAGTQDNGTNRRTSAGSWAQVYGGDGMENGIDWNTPSTMYCSIYYGNFYRSTNSGSSWTTITPSGETNNGSWITPFDLDPTSPQTLYSAYQTVYRSTNRGSSWSSLGTPLTVRATYMAIAPSNPSVIVVGTSSSMYRTTNSGTNWTAITGNLPSNLSNAAIDPQNPAIIWATCSNWSSGQKVFRSTDGGSTWTNISTGLPNVPANCIALDIQGGAYVGTDIGLYYRGPNSSQWISHDDGLPNVIVRDIELDTALGRVYVATYGRGIWQGTMVHQTLQAAIWASRNSLCVNDTIRLTDISTGNPPNRQWTIPGGIPGSSTDSTIVVLFPTAGTYQVQLVVWNASTSDTARLTISVHPRPTVTINTSASFVCEGDSIVLNASGTNINRYQWSTGDTTQRIVLRAIGIYNVYVTVISAAGCSTTSQTVRCTIAARPPVPTITVVGRPVFCTGDSAILQAPGGYASYMWNTGVATQRITVRTSGDYWVTVTDVNGCQRTSDPLIITVFPLPPLSVTVHGSLNLCQGDSVIFIAQSSPGASFFWQDGSSSNRYVARSTGTYAVTVTDTNGCQTKSQQWSVTVFQRPTPKVISSRPATLCLGDSARLELDVPCNTYRWNTGDTTPSITVRRAGQYWCQCTITVRCLGSSDTVSIFEDNTPPPDITSSNGHFIACDGDTLILDAGAGYIQYLWNTRIATRQIHVVESGRYSVAVRTPAGCWKYDTAEVTFVPRPPQPIIVRNGNTLSCVAQARAYQWHRDRVPIPGATEQHLTVSEIGQYSVRITDENGCSAESELYEVISRIEDEQTLTVELVPNPAGDYVAVRCSNITYGITIELYDFIGRLLMQSYLEQHSKTIEHRIGLESISPGIYTIVVRNGTKVGRAQLVRW